MPIIIAIVIVLLDQAVKYACALWLPTLPHSTYPLLANVFHLTYEENKGAAFGMLSSFPWLLYIVRIALIAVIIYILIRKYKEMHSLMRYSLLLVCAGALGNLIDFVFLGYVRDMFNFCLIRFYIFNVADAAITIGTILLMLDILFFKGKDLLGLSSTKQEANTKAPDGGGQTEQNTEVSEGAGAADGE